MVTATHNLLVVVETGIITSKAYQEHYTNHNTAGMINIIKRVLVTAHTQYHRVLVWMDAEQIKVAVLITLCSHLVEVEDSMDTLVVAGVAGVVVDSLK
jgi:hypothetical protein